MNKVSENLKMHDDLAELLFYQGIKWLFMDKDDPETVKE